MRSLLLTLTFFSIITAVNAQTAEEYYKKGLDLKGKKQIDDAITAFKEADKLKENYWEARYELGWCYNDKKQYSQALAMLKPLRKNWPNIPKVFFETGYAFEKLGLPDSAVVAYNECLKLKPDYSGAYRQLGYMAYEKDDYEKALQHFEKFEAAAASPSTDYLYWYRKGFMLNAQKQYEKAKTALLKSLEFKKDYINTYLELGFAHTKLKDAGPALDYFKKAMEMDPKSHIPINGTAEVYRDVLKNMDEAIYWYKKNLDANWKERKANFGMGYCLNAQGKYSEAVPYLKTAIDQENDYTAAYVEIGYSHYMLGNNATALENLNKAMTLNPANENSRYYATLVYIQQKNKTKAQQMVDELKNLNSKHVATLQEKVNKM